MCRLCLERKYMKMEEEEEEEETFCLSETREKGTTRDNWLLTDL